MQYHTNKAVLFEDWLSDNSDEFMSDVLRRIIISAKTISGRIERAAIENLCGSTSITNYHGEVVKTLDVIANDQFITNLGKSKYVEAMISEEDFSVIETNNSLSGRYIVTFDPLDGSSNIDANVNVGSIFGIYPLVSDPNDNPDSNHLRQGKEMICAGYVLYGSSTMLVLSLGGRVDGFCLDGNIGEFILTHPNIKIPTEANIYSVNEGNHESWDDSLRDMLAYIKSSDTNKRPYSQRYIGSMVADVHRTLLYGGLFMYPGSTNAPNGKLRYLYEVAPMSFILENAGGRSLINKSIRALDYKPETIHQRVPVFMGSVSCMDIVDKFIK